MVRATLSMMRDLHKWPPPQRDVFKFVCSAFSDPTSGRGSHLKPLCPTHWTCCASAIKALLDNYAAVYDTLNVIISMGGNTEACQKVPWTEGTHDSV